MVPHWTVLEPSARIDTTSSLGPDVTSLHPTILIVEDDAAFAYAAQRHLEGQGYKVISAGGSIEALEIFEKQAIDLIITDIVLLKGEPHGLSLARTIRNKRPKIPVILVTAYPELLKDEPGLPGLVFNKPVELATLHSAVRACLGRSVT
jgi:two-component system cell cycle sensor histidine kinase/response regulator CckA